MDKQKTGELIKSARIKKGYTQVELGDLLGVTNKAISRWEKGGVCQMDRRCIRCDGVSRHRL
mgnify:CR=1 FL=1